MGVSSSKSYVIDENIDKSYVIDENMIKSFLSEYCEYSPSNFMDMSSFFFAFIVYAKFKYDVHLQQFLSHNDIKKQMLSSLDEHRIETNKPFIYKIGYTESLIIVGVKLNSWPVIDDIENKIT
jgi:hypothetical protein